MIRIVDVASSGNAKTFGTPGNLLIDRDIYRRLQIVVAVPIGSAPEDTNSSLTYFFKEMTKISIGNKSNLSAVKADEFFGSLGLTQYYPHQDNTYTGDLNGS